MLETYIGGMAAAIGVSISLPQIWKTYHLKKADDLSVSMWVLLLTGQILWISYALLREDTILLVANMVAGTQSIVLLSMIYKYRNS